MCLVLAIVLKRSVFLVKSSALTFEFKLGICVYISVIFTTCLKDMVNVENKLMEDLPRKR